MAFIKSQIEQYDEFYQKAEKYAADGEAVDKDRTNHPEESRHTATVPVSGDNRAITLGAKRKTLAIRELLEAQSKDAAFTSFCSRVSLAVQELSSEPADTVAVNDSHQVRYISLMSSVY